ncbi:hypothetical protein N478_25885 [Pseudoalteromonas luteoviolacea S4060-1]|uniref:JAB domain-containing protein n=2 Tax=Pseudoalteromonas luteoviolacea TaxID=43657 RepID=A0A167JAL9_9GAMM|nr:hypothetical protein N478_25885 [Pseudoalteromonas luteoviolacea S4060-1]
MEIEIHCDKPININFTGKILETFEKFSQTGNNLNEACGVLIGGMNTENNTIFIDTCTTPGKQDKRHPKGYLMKDTKHQKAINHAFKTSGGTSFLLGTWHTHPEEKPTPSAVDKGDWTRIMKRNSDILPVFVFVIVGTEKISVYTYIS